MGRFKMKSLGRRAKKDREKCQEEELTKGETTEDSWKLVDYPTSLSESGQTQKYTKFSVRKNSTAISVWFGCFVEFGWAKISSKFFSTVLTLNRWISKICPSSIIIPYSRQL